jgi:hypothetical protein
VFFAVVLVEAEATLLAWVAAIFVAGLTSFALSASTLLPLWSQDPKTSRAMTIKTDLLITEEYISPSLILHYAFFPDLLERAGLIMLV